MTESWLQFLSQKEILFIYTIKIPAIEPLQKAEPRCWTSTSELRLVPFSLFPFSGAVLVPQAFSLPALHPARSSATCEAPSAGVLGLVLALTGSCDHAEVVCADWPCGSLRLGVGPEWSHFTPERSRGLGGKGLVPEERAALTPSCGYGG